VARPAAERASFAAAAFAFAAAAAASAAALRRAFFASVLALPTANATLKATCPAGIGWLLLMLRAMILSWAQGPFNKSM
jgi:hypothetical protein